MSHTFRYSIRELRWEDADYVISNYYSFLDELKENPLLGITTPSKRPELSYEFRWFADLFSSILQGKL